MKFKIKKSIFTKKLIDTERAISSKTTIPVLTGIKISAEDTTLTLTGSNADISIETLTNNVEIIEEGTIVLPARFFIEIIKKLPEEDILISINENLQVSIESGSTKFSINGLDPNTYPTLPIVDTKNGFVINGKKLKDIIDTTVIATSKQESRPILTGIHFIINNQKLIAVSTDSHRLSQVEETGENLVDKLYDVVIPGRAMLELSRMIDEKEDINVSISENQVLFIFKETKFYSRLLEGMYPDTTHLIPEESTTHLLIDGPTLLSSIDRASLLSHAGRNNVVKLSISDINSNVVLSSNSPDVGLVEESLNFDSIVGEDIEISFNPDYLRDALRVLGQGKINLGFTTPLRPFTLKNEDNEKQIVELITPIRTY